MNLSVFERWAILQILPQDGGDIGILKLVRDLGQHIGFGEAEHKLYDFKVTIRCAKCKYDDDFSMTAPIPMCPICNLKMVKTGNIKWNDKIDQNKDIEIGEKSLEIIANGFRTMQDSGHLPVAYLDVYHRFVEGGEEAKPVVIPPQTRAERRRIEKRGIK